MAFEDYERSSSLESTVRTALTGAQAGIWTALPGIVQSFDASAVTAVVQPAIKAMVTRPDGEKQAAKLPLLLDCPVVFPRGGGCTLTFPVKAGDACLIVCCESTLSQWQSGNYASGLRFGLSNAICVPCLLKAAPAAVSKAKAKDAAILFCKQAEVLVGKDEIHAEYKKNVATVKLSDEGIETAFKETTKVSIKEKEITGQAGDDEHKFVVQEGLALLQCKQAKALVSDDIASLQLDTDSGVVIGKNKLTASLGADAKIELSKSSVKAALGDQKRIEIGSGAAGIYYDSGHYIESKADETYVEGNLHVGGSLIGG